MMTDEPPNFRELIQFLRIIWTHGNTQTRFFLFMFVGFFIWPIMAIIIIGSNSVPFPIMNGVLLAWITGNVYHIGFFQSFVSDSSMLKTLMDNDWEYQDEYTLSYLDYLQKHCKNGVVPGNFEWGVAFWALFYATLIISYFFGTMFYPVFGGAIQFITLLVVSVPGLLLFTAMIFTKNKLLNRRAMEKGYDLQKLKEEAIEKRRQEIEKKLKVKKVQENNQSPTFILLLVVGIITVIAGVLLWNIDSSYYLFSIALVIIGAFIELIGLHLANKKRMR